jgi:hypothetical protein
VLSRSVRPHRPAEHGWNRRVIVRFLRAVVHPVRVPGRCTCSRDCPRDPWSAGLPQRTSIVVLAAGMVQRMTVAHPAMKGADHGESRCYSPSGLLAVEIDAFGLHRGYVAVKANKSWRPRCFTTTRC